MTTVTERWTRALNIDLAWEKIWRQRYIWNPTPENKRKLEERRAQIAYDRRVLARHKDDKPTPASGFDLSNNNGAVNFTTAKKAGEDFVYVKAGEGDWRDPDFATYVKGGVAAGLHVGGYQFLSPRPRGHGSHEANGAAEARWFADRLRSVGLGAGDLRPVADVEQTNLGKSDTHAYVEGFISELRRQHFVPMIYTGAWFWDPHVGGSNLGCRLWVSGYVGDESKLVIPGSWKDEGYTIWQYTAHGTVPGVAGGVDRNICKNINDIIA